MEKIGGLMLVVMLTGCGFLRPQSPAARPNAHNKGQAAPCPTASPWATAANGLVGVAQGYAAPEPQPSADATAAGCAKDTDCKGDRVCDRGACVAPKP